MKASECLKVQEQVPYHSSLETLEKRRTQIMLIKMHGGQTALNLRGLKDFEI